MTAHFGVLDHPLLRLSADELGSRWYSSRKWKPVDRQLLERSVTQRHILGDRRKLAFRHPHPVQQVGKHLRSVHLSPERLCVGLQPAESVEEFPACSAVPQ